MREFNRRTVLGGTAAAALAAPVLAAQSSVGGGKTEKDILGKLERYAAQHRADWGLPGMTLAIVDRTGFAGFVRSGWAHVEKKIPIGQDHLFQIGSISKMIAAMAVWSLIEEGKLSPETRLSDLLKGITVRGGKAITLQHLLDHTSGLPSDSSPFREGGLWSGFEPGSSWSYSNCGYVLAGMMAQAADGRSYREMVEARVLKKLGMLNSVGALQIADRGRYAQGYEPALTDRLNLRPSTMTPSPWVDSDNPAGCIAATAGDMAIFMRFLLDLAEEKGAPLFSDATAARFLSEPAEGWSPGSSYGNGVARVKIDGRDYLHHTGGMVSFCSALHVDPLAGVAAFASANVHYSLNYRPRDVTTYACSLLRVLREGGDAVAPKPTKPVVEKPERFVGVFTSAVGDAIEIRSEAGALGLRRNGSESALQQAAPNLFAATEPEFAVTGIAFDFEGDVASRAWIGAVEYARHPEAGFLPAAPEELQRLSGRYDNDDRWAGPLYVYARAGKLWIGNAQPLTPLKGGEWRLGEKNSPERIRFDNFVNERPQVLLFSSTPFARRFS